MGQGGPAGAGVSRRPESLRAGHSGQQVWHRGRRPCPHQRGAGLNPGQGGTVPDFDAVHCLEIWKSGNLEIWKSGNLEIWKSGMLVYPGPENWKSDAPHGLAPCRVPGFQNFRFSHCSNSLRCRQYARSLNGKFHSHQSSWQFTQVLFPEGPVCTRNLPFPSRLSTTGLPQRNRTFLPGSR